MRPSTPPVVIIVMGVSGSGKSTIGERLSVRLEVAFLDADSLHPARNIGKMSRGEPLTDADRADWLEAVRQHIVEALRTKTPCVLACSALKEAYRHRLVQKGEPVHLVYLDGSFETIQERLRMRAGHFMPVALLRSQFDALEPPKDAHWVSVEHTPDEIVEEIVAHLQESKG